MKRSGMVLFGALLWLAWHLGTLSAPAPLSNNGHGGSWDNRQTEASATGLHPALQRFAVESEQFLGHSAHALNDDSRYLWERFHPTEAPANENRWTANSWRREAASSTKSNWLTAAQSGLDMAWKQVEPLMVMVQPLAQASWNAVQTGWHQFMDGRSETTDSAAPSTKEPSWHTRQAHSGRYETHHRYDREERNY